MAKTSAGLLMYRVRDGAPEVLLVHPGGPLWAAKDEGAWSIPKGVVLPGEDTLAAARREFAEETGFVAEGRFLPLTPLRQPSGKVIHAWAFEGDAEPAQLRSNLFSLEWPPKSGRHQPFPEVDRAGWFPLAAAHRKIIPGQGGFLAALVALLDRAGRQPDPGSP
jgi:predicted NUDIX family NTP pyrophosphohydrolase